MENTFTLGEITARVIEKVNKRRDIKQLKISYINKSIMERMIAEKMKELDLEYDVEYTKQDAVHTDQNKWCNPEDSDGFELRVKLKGGMYYTYQFHYEDMEYFLNFINNLSQNH